MSGGHVNIIEQHYYQLYLAHGDGFLLVFITGTETIHQSDMSFVSSPSADQPASGLLQVMLSLRTQHLWRNQPRCGDGYPRPSSSAFLPGEVWIQL